MEALGLGQAQPQTHSSSLCRSGVGKEWGQAGFLVAVEDEEMGSVSAPSRDSSAPQSPQRLPCGKMGLIVVMEEDPPKSRRRGMRVWVALGVGRHPEI